jgi:hypothetical protein
MSAIPAITHPSSWVSSQIGVDFSGGHPNPSQIGVRFSDYPSFGVAFRRAKSRFCQIPRANCQEPFLSKTVQRTTFPLWSEFLILPFFSPFCQAKMARSPGKKMFIRGVEQAFYA